MEVILETTILCNKPKTKLGHILVKTLCCALLICSVLLFFSATWYINHYGDTGFDSVLFTLFSNMNGVDSGILKNFALDALLPTFFVSALCFCVIFLIRIKKEWFFKIKLWHKSAIALIIALIFLICAGSKVSIFGYAYKLMHKSTLFDDFYIDPAETEIIFPEEKQNLIYIFLESIENSYMSKADGGALPKNIMKELTHLADKNINFSHNSSVGGFFTPPGSTWTVAAMVSQSAGIPLKASPGTLNNNEYGKDAFLPGATTLTDILHQNGYNQALMVGSNASFANRDIYYKNHNTDFIYDLNTAKEDKLIPEDYYVWWGMEDTYLFDYAKDKLLEMSKEDKPFSLTLLTVDTHFADGFICNFCKNEYHEQYSNVISCASRQVHNFVNWLKKQSFYKNTTIVIAGDHLTMDNEYIQRNVDENYERTVYNCFINSKTEAENFKNRVFTSFDMFPTTLSAIGCEIGGERLGLGTNLFSQKPTLAEEIGYDELSYQLDLSSKYYIKNFLIKQ